MDSCTVIDTLRNEVDLANRSRSLNDLTAGYVLVLIEIKYLQEKEMQQMHY